MKIVFLDKQHFQQADEVFDYSLLNFLGTVVCYNTTTDEELFSRINDADIIILLKTQLPGSVIGNLKKTRLICKLGTGYDNIDVQTAKAVGIKVTNFPGYGESMVAQWTMTLMLMLAGNVLLYDKASRANQWQASQFMYPITEIHNKTLGIIGYGSIGKQVAKMAQVLGMKILVSTKYADNASNIGFVDKETIYRNSDFISLHSLLNDETRAMVDTKAFQMMKQSGYLINTGRAALVCKESLKTALESHTISGAAIDGFWQEPPEQNDPLLTLNNIIITPHVGWSSHETRQRLLQSVSHKIKDFIDGNAIHTL